MSIDTNDDNWKSKLSRRGFLATSAATTGSFFLGKFALAKIASSATPVIASIKWENLRQKIKGEVITSAAPDFATVRSAMVWNNLKPNRSPDVIIKVKNDEDVVQAVNFARENKLKVVVHGGGHNWCGLAVRNGGMTIDLSELNQSTIDKDNKTAVIQPVISNRELARRLGEYDLAFPTGHCPTVKASGYLLNGGMSWNMGQWGPACLSVEAIDFVTADGKMVHASEKEHSDLFWAGRGCGPGMFAVATRFHLKCYDLPKAITGSTYFYSLRDLKEVVEYVATQGRKMPEYVELSIFMSSAPPELAEQCKDFNGKVCMVAAVAFGTSKDQAEAALAPLEEGATVKKALSKTLNDPSNFQKLADASGASWPENHRNLCENQCSKANPADMFMALRDKFVQAPSAKSVVVFCQSTGSKNLLTPHEDVALSMDATTYGGCWTIWEKEEHDAENRKWHDEMVDLIKPFTNQHYIGETNIAQEPARVQESFAPKKWDRLEEVRAKYDPEGVFFGFLGGITKEA